MKSKKLRYINSQIEKLSFLKRVPSIKKSLFHSLNLIAESSKILEQAAFSKKIIASLTEMFKKGKLGLRMKS